MRHVAASFGRHSVVTALLLLGLGACVDHGLKAQTLARPGWAGSGLTVTEWWRNAVLFEVSGDPEVSPASGAPIVTVNRLTDLLGRLDDLQALGADAVLLRGIDRVGTASPEGRIASSYGSLDQFDDLLREASRRRIRVLVELPGSLDGDDLRGAARFWLSRGVSGLSLASGAQAADSIAPPALPTRAAAAGVAAHGSDRISLLHEAMRGYAGERVLLIGGDADARAGTPQVSSIVLGGFVAGQPVDLAALRQSLVAARAAFGGRHGGTVARIASQAGPVRGAAAQARASVLLMVAGGVALGAGEVGEGPAAQAITATRAQQAKDEAALAAATSPAGVSNVKRAIAARAGTEPPHFAGDTVFRWSERMIGLHRGNPAMLQGEQTLLDHDKDGAVVSVWRGRAGQVLCEIVNLRDAPTELSLAQEFAAMHERGSFLRPVARTDAGMGAMPLARVKLSAYGVFVGELGR